MFCIKCGENLPDEAKFCFKCGENLVKAKNTIEQPDNHQNQEPIIQANNYQNQQQVVHLNNNQEQKNHQNQISQSNNYQNQYQTTPQNYSNPNQKASNKGAGTSALKVIGLMIAFFVILSVVCVFGLKYIDEMIMITSAKDSFYDEFPVTNFGTMIDYTFDNAKWTIIDSKNIYFTGTHKGSNEDYYFTFKFDEDVGLASYFYDDIYTGDVIEIDMNIGGNNYKHEISYITYWLFDIADSKKDLPTEKFDISMLIEEELEIEDNDDETQIKVNKAEEPVVEDNTETLTKVTKSEVPTSDKSDYEKYAFILDAIKTSINNGVDADYLGLPKHYFSADVNQPFMGYDFVDINNDGINELFISDQRSRGNFIAAYTYSNGTILSLQCSSGYSWYVDLTEHGFIITTSSNDDGSTSITYSALFGAGSTSLESCSDVPTTNLYQFNYTPF